MQYTFTKGIYELPQNYSFEGFIKVEDGVLHTRSTIPQIKIDFLKSIPSATIQGTDTVTKPGQTSTFQDFDMSELYTFYFYPTKEPSKLLCKVYYGKYSDNPDESNLYREVILLRLRD